MLLVYTYATDFLLQGTCLAHILQNLILSRRISTFQDFTELLHTIRLLAGSNGSQMDLPTFNTDALRTLTQNIETSFKNPRGRDSNTTSKAKKGPDVQARAVREGEGRKGKKRTRDGYPKEKTSGPNGIHASNIPQAGGDRNPVPKERSKLDFNEQRSKNRLKEKKAQASRKLKNEEKFEASQRNGQAAHTTATKVSTKSQLDLSSSTAKASLQDELKALGGDEEDLKLIEGAASDSEVEGSKLQDNDSQLVKELQKYAKDLGIHSETSRGVDFESCTVEHVEEHEQGQVDHGETAKKHVESLQGKKLGWKEEREARKKVEKLAREKQPTAPPLKKGLPKSVAKGSKKTIYTPQSEWHTVSLAAIPVPNQTLMPQKETIDQLHQYAVSLLDEDGENYTTYNNSTSAHQFYSTIMSSGTLSDKISALTLSVQESPVHNVKALESLVNLARKRSRQQAVEVLGALKDLLGPGNLLPSDRKLRFFATQPSLAHIFEPKVRWQVGDSLPGSLGESHLIAWAYEDKLKSIYFEILQIIETWCNDEVVFARGKAVDYVFELLRDKPEQEANLLRLLVNKLGDSDKSIASKISYDLLQLQNTHPAMRMTVISAVESDLLFRPGQSMHAKYYAIITLNQTVLGGKDETISKKLLEIYFTMFVSLLKKPEVMKKAQQAPAPAKYNTKGEKQGGGGVAGKKAQKKLAGLEKGKAVDEEFREKLLSAVLTGVNRAMPYAKADDEVFDKHMDTLFRVTHSSNFNTSMQALMLIQQLCGSHQTASSRFYRTTYESLLDPRLLTSSKQAMYLNLLFRALRADLSVKRVKAFAKRLLQVVMMHQASFACGVIYLLRQLESVFASLATFADQPEDDESDEEEVFRDVPENGALELPARVIAIKEGQRSKLAAYDGKKREPEYSNAERSCLWEIVSE